MFVKKSKCACAVTQMDYLGNVIFPQGVAMDMQKVDTVLNWPQPTNLEVLRGLLGLASYYRRFVGEFGTIAKPLNNRLKKSNFKWNQTAIVAFCKQKKAIASAPVLALQIYPRNS